MVDKLQIEVLNLLGLSIKDGRVYDQDKMNYLMFNGNYIRSKDSPIMHRRDIELDILHNKKLMEYFLNILFQKEEEENGLYVQLFSINEIRKGDSPYVKTQGKVNAPPDVYLTDWYYNYCLSCIHLIYAVTGTPLSFDLHKLDYTEEDMIQMYENKVRA